MKKEEVEQRVEALVLPILEKNRFELVDVEYVREGSNRYLRAYIDKKGGITIDDCELVSRALEEELDREDFIEDAYILEISSPGLGRPLKKPRDFERSIGEEVEIHFFRVNEEAGGKEAYGILKAFDDNTITVDDEDNKAHTFERTEISMIRLALDF